MTEIIGREWQFFLATVKLGAAITFTYDLIRIFRMLIPHFCIFIALEDILFWLGCTWSVFCLQFEMNQGVTRFFSILGVMMGMLLYYRILGKWLIGIVESLSERLKRRLTVFFKTVRMSLGGRKNPSAGSRGKDGKTKNSSSEKEAESGSHVIGVNDSVDAGAGSVL